jgi:hypothetical protein
MNVNEEEQEIIGLVDVDRQEADLVIARRHGEGTEAAYEAAMKKFKIWLSLHNPRALTGTDADDIRDREIILPLQRDSTMAFLGQVQRLKLRGNQIEEIPADQPPIAVSTMTAIGSALSDLYKKANTTIAEDLKSEINKFMKGYKRTINNLKQNGKRCCTNTYL